MRLTRWVLPPLFAVFFGLILSGMAMAVLDGEGPVGADKIVWVNDALPGRSQAPRAEVDEALSRFATERGVAVARERPDPTRAAMARTLYVAEPARGPRVPRRSFHPMVQQEVKGLSEDPRVEVRAFYYVYGDDRGELGPLFARLGYGVQTFPPFPSVRILTYSLGGYLAPLVALCVLLTGGMPLALALQDARHFAVARLNGQGRVRIAIDVMARAARPALVLAAASAAACLAILVLLNGGQEWRLFLVTASLLTSGLLLVVGVGFVVGIRLATARRIREGLAGRSDSAPALVGLGIINAAAIAAVISVTVSIGLLSADLERTRTAPAPSESVAYLTLSGSVATREEDVTAMKSAVGVALRTASQRGQVVFANPGYDGAETVPLPGGPGVVLVINDAYLRAHPYIASAIGGVPRTERDVHVYIPPERRARAQELRHALEEEFRAVAPATGFRMPTMRTHVNPVDEWPVYPDVNGLYRKTSVARPIVVVLRSDLRPVSDDNILAAVSSSRAMFTSEEQGRSVVREFGLEDYIVSVVDARQAHAEARARTTRILAQQWGALVVGGLVLVLTSLTLAALWVQSRRQRLYVQWINGHSWWKRHAMALLVYAGLVALALAMTAYLTAPDVHSVLPPGEGDRLALRTPAQAATALLAFGVFTAALAAVSTRTEHLRGQS